MKKEHVSYLLIATLILASLTWFMIDVTYSPGYIELVNFKAELDENGTLRENNAVLKWHGANGTEHRRQECHRFQTKYRHRHRCND